MLKLVVISIFPLCLAYAALSDIQRFKIPNEVSIALALAFPLAAFYLGAPPAAIFQSLLIGAAALSVGFTLFAFNIVGGGDAKLFAAAAPWIGLSAMMHYALWMVLAGGLLSLSVLLFRATPVLPLYIRFGWLMRLHDSRRGVPYGVAIAVGGLAAFPHTELFKLAFGY